VRRMGGCSVFLPTREKIRPDEIHFTFCPCQITQKNVAKGEMPRRRGHRTHRDRQQTRDLCTKATLRIVASSSNDRVT
jgi:hypothetical protein